MKLNDLRKLAVREQTRIKFPLSNGKECIVTETGISRVEGLTEVPDFNLEDELAGATRFVLERRSSAPRPLQRPELEKLLAPLAGAAAHHHDHDE
ncbi:MAG: hypothetical protein SFV54_20240 [Bryobacteraceae bacterium]|nr:hypothetical protein [Bryobacteraceae bacterium]